MASKSSGKTSKRSWREKNAESTSPSSYAFMMSSTVGTLFGSVSTITAPSLRPSALAIRSKSECIFSFPAVIMLFFLRCLSFLSFLLPSSAFAVRSTSTCSSRFLRSVALPPCPMPDPILLPMMLEQPPRHNHPLSAEERLSRDSCSGWREGRHSSRQGPPRRGNHPLGSRMIDFHKSTPKPTQTSKAPGFEARWGRRDAAAGGSQRSRFSRYSIHPCQLAWFSLPLRLCPVIAIGHVKIATLAALAPHGVGRNRYRCVKSAESCARA